MDDKRFDGLAKQLATGRSRRSVLRGVLGLGGAAAAGGTLLQSEVDAARRPTPTPKPVRCPGRQTWNGTACVCPADAPQTCGGDCCNPAGTGAAHSECCDGACCFGVCYGEERCCASGSVCNGECCPDGFTCCEGVCFDPAGGICCNDVPVAGNCCGDAECGGGAVCCDHVCDERGYCGNCKPNGIICASHPECCSGWCTSGVCSNQPPPCVREGGSCFSSNECCDDLWCDSSRCSQYGA